MTDYNSLLLTQQIEDLEKKEQDLLQQLDELVTAKKSLVDQRRQLESKTTPSKAPCLLGLTPKEKIAIFRGLFRGREDVYPQRRERPNRKPSYEPVGTSGWSCRICRVAKAKPRLCQHRIFSPLTDAVIYHHLAGTKNKDGCPTTIGIYPLLKDNTCWFLAVDFDKRQWQRDASSFLRICKAKNVPAYLERSRSGNGAHVWMFFSDPIPAVTARRMGTYLLTQTMEQCPEIGLDSYDRFFPNQDKLPIGGFGNLIALPLQKIPREKGNSVFLNDSFEPQEDQWAFLSSVQKMSVEDEIKDPWASPPSRKRAIPKLEGVLPSKLSVVIGNQLYVPKKDLPPPLINRIIRLAAFQNPEFYKKQAMRMPVFNIPRVIHSAELFPEHIALPRGCLEGFIHLLTDLGVEVTIQEERFFGEPIRAKFSGELTPDQTKAAESFLKHDMGVLAATTGFGKTVIGAYMIAARRCNTLILVHRSQLKDQWMDRLKTFLKIPPDHIGYIGGGKRKPSGKIDIALIQSLGRKEGVDDLVAGYGQVIVDECHHISALTFESVIKECKAKFVLGLTATAVRKDGHHPIIFMQCGPIRHKVDAKKEAGKRPFSHHVLLRRTNFRVSENIGAEKIQIQDLYAALAGDSSRNEQIFNDVLNALEQGRSPLILTERKEHVNILAERFRPLVKNMIVLYGSMKSRDKKESMKQLLNSPKEEKRLLIATGRFLGEGFDDARLDTLFLAMPVSWKGTVAQYAGRLHRNYEGKEDVQIYDYVDENVPILLRMSEKRMQGYNSIGYSLAPLSLKA